MLDKKDVVSEINDNFEEIQQAVSRMEFELLKTLLERRSQLLAVLVDGVLDDPGPDGTRARDSISAISRQNAVIRARVESRAEDDRSQLEELYRREQRSKAFQNGD